VLTLNFLSPIGFLSALLNTCADNRQAAEKFGQTMPYRHLLCNPSLPGDPNARLNLQDILRRLRPKETDYLPLASLQVPARSKQGVVQMKPEPFRLERYFAEHEFSAPHLLCRSDCESVSIRDLLQKEQRRMRVLALRLGYTESPGITRNCTGRSPHCIIGPSVERFCRDFVDQAGVLLLPGTLYHEDLNCFRVGFGRFNMPACLEKLVEFLIVNLIPSPLFSP